jgi:hypothetical protein
MKALGVIAMQFVVDYIGGGCGGSGSVHGVSGAIIGSHDVSSFAGRG